MENYVLQNRWLPEGNKLYYYGLRNRENLFRNTLPLSKKQRQIIAKLPSPLTAEECSALGKLLGEQVVKEKDLRKTPASLREARFCTSCAANDYIIPGLEFDGE